MDEIDLAEIGRVERVDDDEGLARVRGKEPAVAPRQTGLTADLGAEGNRMQDGAGIRLPDPVILVEDILARRVVLVGVKRDLRLVRRHRATAGSRSGSAAGTARIDVPVSA